MRDYGVVSFLMNGYNNANKWFGDREKFKKFIFLKILTIKKTIKIVC